MKILKKIFYGFLFLLAIPTVFLIIALILTIIPVNNSENAEERTQTIYLQTSGIHLEIILEKKDISEQLLKGLNFEPEETYFSFGWGDENFYINTPTWGDLTFKNAFIALCMKSPSLVHLTRYPSKQTGWTAVSISTAELEKINALIESAFLLDKNGNKIILTGKGYKVNDDFYKSNAAYTCFNTCNTWINTIFKESGLKACLWTPFDFGLLNKYQ